MGARGTRHLVVVFTALLAVSLPAAVAGQNPSGNWLARCDGGGFDWAFRVRVGPSGAVLVAGTSRGSDGREDFLTVKYDPAGNETWRARHDLGNGGDFASMAVDASGNVVVTGYVLDDSNKKDFLTVKYDPDGNELWAVSYDGPIGMNEEPCDLALSGDGSVHVAGSSTGVETTQSAIVKYDPDGNELWVARYNRAPTRTLPVAMAVDPAGDVYVTASSLGYRDDPPYEYPHDDYTTLKYDRDGSLIWAEHYDGPAVWTDLPADLALDPDGNVIVTGVSFTVADFSAGVFRREFTTLKYDDSGSLLWVETYDSSGSTDSEGQFLTVDASGNILVTGQFISPVPPYSWDIATVKYGPEGVQLWADHYAGPWDGDDVPYAMALDPAGDVYITGACEGSYGYQDYLTLKYAAGGGLVWEARYDGFRDRVDQARSVALDEQGNVHVTGLSHLDPEAGGDFVTLRNPQICTDDDGDGYGYPPTSACPEPDWDCDDADALVHPGAAEGPSGDPTCSDLKDNDCDGYVDGQDSDCPPQPALEAWVARYATPEPERARALAVDELGFVYVTGVFSAYGVYEDYGTVKYGPDGEELWVATYPSGLEARDIAVDAQGSVFVTGEGATVKYETDGALLWAVDASTTYDALVLDDAGNVYLTDASCRTVKLDAAGNEIWWNSCGLSTDTNIPADIAMDGAGNLYVSGTLQGASGGVLVAKYDSEGNRHWVATYDEEDHREEAHSLAVDADGFAWVAGNRSDLSSPGDYLTIEIDPDGNLLWTRADHFGDEAETACCIGVDESGHVVVTGTGGDIDYATVKYDADGNPLWSALYDGPGHSVDVPSALALDAWGNVYVTGTSVAQDGNQDLTTIKYDPSGRQLWEGRYDGQADFWVGDGAEDMVVDAAGTVYVTGSSVSPDYASGTVDYDFVTTKYIPCTDADGDGYGDGVTGGGDFCLFSTMDCDDSDTGVNPGSSEICDNGRDDDCNGLVDVADPTCAAPPWGSSSIIGRGGSGRDHAGQSGTFNYAAMLLFPCAGLILWKGLERRRRGLPGRTGPRG